MAPLWINPQYTGLFPYSENSKPKDLRVGEPNQFGDKNRERRTDTTVLRPEL